MKLQGRRHDYGSWQVWGPRGPHTCCQLRLIRRSLTTDAAHTLVRALIHSRLDYCNGLFAGLPTRLQSVLRPAARLVIRVPSRAPVSAVMRDVLHWLNFPERVPFKLCLLTYKCLHGLAPKYLSRFCVPRTVVPGRSQLCSADDRHSRWVRELSAHQVLRHPDLTIGAYKRQLKTVLLV